MTALCIVGPICVQTILFLRVLAVYPPHQQSPVVRIGMYGPAIAMKLARVVNAAYLLYMVQRGSGAKTIVGQSAAVWDSPFAKSELSLQLVDDVYVLPPSERISLTLTRVLLSDTSRRCSSGRYIPESSSPESSVEGIQATVL